MGGRVGCFQVWNGEWWTELCFTRGLSIGTCSETHIYRQCLFEAVLIGFSRFTSQTSNLIMQSDIVI